MTEIQDQCNPKEIAEYFSSIQKRYGYHFDFSLKSLETEVDRFLEENANLSSYNQKIMGSILTAYVGESVCRLYNGKWVGKYSGPLNKKGSNFDECWIEIKGFKYYPSHFLQYYLSNGKRSEGTFYDYLYSRSKSKGIFEDFLGGGLINKIKTIR